MTTAHDPNLTAVANAVKTGTSLTNRVRSRKLPPVPDRVTEQIGENVILNVDLLKVDHSYQRPADPYHIANMATNFDWKRLFRIAVNKRPDGSYFILDGQQRTEALKLMGGDCDIDCVLYHLNTVEEEAGLYYHLNWDRKNTSAFDRWRARLALGDADVVRIQDDLDRYNLKLARSGDALRTIKAIGTLHSWVERDVEALSIAIMILGKLTYHDPIGSEVFSGLCYVENHLRNYGNSLVRARSQRETWANFLVGRGYADLDAAANRFQSDRKGIGGGGTVAKQAAKGILALLNFNLKSGRLPELKN